MITKYLGLICVTVGTVQCTVRYGTTVVRGLPYSTVILTGVTDATVTYCTVRVLLQACNRLLILTVVRAGTSSWYEYEYMVDFSFIVSLYVSDLPNVLM